MKPAATMAVVFLAPDAIRHFTRVLSEWEASGNGAAIPVLLNGVAAVIVGALSTMGWRDSRRRPML
jgi:hypothetical protein